MVTIVAGTVVTITQNITNQTYDNCKKAKMRVSNYYSADESKCCKRYK